VRKENLPDGIQGESGDQQTLINFFVSAFLIKKEAVYEEIVFVFGVFCGLSIGICVL